MSGAAARASGGGSAGIRALWQPGRQLNSCTVPKRWARDCAKDGRWGKKSASAASKKGLYSAGRGVYQDLGRLNQILIQVHYGTYVHITSSGGVNRRKCRNETLENLYQKAPCRGVLRGYQRNRLAERGEGSGECLRMWQRYQPDAQAKGRHPWVWTRSLRLRCVFAGGLRFRLVSECSPRRYDNR